MVAVRASSSGASIVFGHQIGEVGYNIDMVDDAGTPIPALDERLPDHGETGFVEDLDMKYGLLPAIVAGCLAAASAAPSAHAKGCIKGAVVGGVAGHYAGHHAILGAVGGCIVGHHLAAKHAREEKAQHLQDQQSQQQPQPDPTSQPQPSSAVGH
jgi:hypothetical protein